MYFSKKTNEIYRPGIRSDIDFREGDCEGDCDFGFGTLKYYNGSVVCKTKLLRNLRMTTNSFAFQSEVLIRLVKKNYNYIKKCEYYLKSEFVF